MEICNQRSGDGQRIHDSLLPTKYRIRDDESDALMSRLSFSSLRVRLLFLVLLALVPSFVLIAYSAWEHRLTAAATAKEQTLKFARDAVQQQYQLISQSRRLLGELAQRPEIDLTRATTCSAFLAGQLKEHPNYTLIGLAALDGTIKCSAVPLTRVTSVSDRTFFRKTLETGDFSIGDYVIGRATGKAAVTFGYPILGNSGKLEGVVFAALDLSWLNQTLTKAETSRDSVLTLIDLNGIILARSVEPQKWLGKTIAQSPLLSAILGQQQEGTVESPEAALQFSLEVGL
jgi:hypothetical protein